MARVTIDLSGLRKQFALEMADIERKMRFALDASGYLITNHLKELTENETADGRLKHVGGWADRTGQLANSYTHQVTAYNGTFKLEISNGAEYAVYLDKKEGLFVLKGVLDNVGDIGVEIVHKQLQLALPNYQISF